MLTARIRLAQMRRWTGKMALPAISKGKIMTPIEPFKIQSEPEVEAYLADLFKNNTAIALEEIKGRAQKLIDDERLRQHFVDRAKTFIKP